MELQLLYDPDWEAKMELQPLVEPLEDLDEDPRQLQKMAEK